jgi:hypothetical protein
MRTNIPTHPNINQKDSFILYRRGLDHISKDLSGEEKLAKLMRRHENNYHMSKGVSKGPIAELKVA